MPNVFDVEISASDFITPFQFVDVITLSQPEIVIISLGVFEVNAVSFIFSQRWEVRKPIVAIRIGMGFPEEAP